MTPILPDSFLRRIDPKDRVPMGKAGMTADECSDKAQAVAEKQMHNELIGWLNLNQIKFIHAPMNKKSPLPPGWPDFSIFTRGGVRLIEFKTPSGKTSSDQ